MGNDVGGGVGWGLFPGRLKGGVDVGPGNEGVRVRVAVGEEVYRKIVAVDLGVGVWDIFTTGVSGDGIGGSIVSIAASGDSISFIGTAWHLSISLSAEV